MIIRVKRRELPFVQVDKSAIDDDSLSWRAKGLLVYLIAKPDNWNCNMKQLSGASAEGRDATRKAMQELAKAGYVKKKPHRTRSGTVRGWDWEVFELPQGGGDDSGGSDGGDGVPSGPIVGDGAAGSDCERPAVAVPAFKLGGFIDIWARYYRGDFFPSKHAAKFKEYSAKHGYDELLAAFEVYCKRTSEEFASPMSFIGKVGAYLPSQTTTDLDAFLVK